MPTHCKDQVYALTLTPTGRHPVCQGCGAVFSWHEVRGWASRKQQIDAARRDFEQRVEAYRAFV